MSLENKTIKLSIVSDVVCPWCVIGYRQLAKAAKEQNIELDITWHPFQLNPTMAGSGQNLREHLIEKYGISVEDSISARKNIEEIGNNLDFEFNFSDDSRIFNTFAAHKLLTLAKQFGKQHELKQALFNAYFAEQLDVSDETELLKIAVSVGLEQSIVEQALKNDQLSSVVKEEVQFFQSKGITGVPAMIFEEKYLVTGAQGEENYSKILNQLKEQA